MTSQKRLGEVHHYDLTQETFNCNKNIDEIMIDYFVSFNFLFKISLLVTLILCHNTVTSHDYFDPIYYFQVFIINTIKTLSSA